MIHVLAGQGKNISIAAGKNKFMTKTEQESLGEILLCFLYYGRRYSSMIHWCFFVFRS